MHGAKWSLKLPQSQRIINTFTGNSAFSLLILFIFIYFFRRCFRVTLTLVLALYPEAPGITPLQAPSALSRYINPLKFQGWSKSQLQLFLLRCGDVESNPGPPFRLPPLKVWQWNCRAIRNTEAEFRHQIQRIQPDIVLLQETWLQPSKTFAIPGYTILRRDRSAARGGDGAIVRGGGIITMIRDDPLFNAEIMEAVEPIRPDDSTEILQVRLFWDRTPIVITNVYAPILWQVAGEVRLHQFDADNILTECLNMSPEQLHLIAGDFNAHHATWDDSYLDRDPDERGTGIAEWCVDNGMVVGNTGSPTWAEPRAAGRRSAPDLTIISPGLSVRDWASRSAMGSDHYLVAYHLDVAGDGTQVRYRPPELKRWTQLARNISTDQWAEFNQVAGSFIDNNPLERKQLRSISHRYSRFLTALKVAAKRLPRGCRYDPVPWWNAEIEAAVDKRDELEQKRQEDPRYTEEWREYVVRVKELSKQLRCDAWRKFASTLRYSSNPHVTARVVRQINREPRTTTTICLKGADGRPLVGDERTARAFRSVYANVSAVDRSTKRTTKQRLTETARRERVVRYCKRPPLPEGPERRRQYDGPCAPFTEAEFADALAQMSTTSAPGEDRVHPRMLHELSQPLRKELLYIINLSWRQGRCPSRWLSGVIVPIHKPGKPKEELTSYRPVCLTSALAKLAERMVCARLRYLLEKTGALPETQSGSRVGRSTLDPLLRLVTDVHAGFIGHESTLATLIDFSRAYDKVDRLILLEEFDKLHIPKMYGRWFSSFLMDRRYAVRYGSAISGYKRFACGVPQGTVSGPLLFLIYTRSLSLRLAAVGPALKYHKFVDDLTLWTSSKSREQQQRVMQEGLYIVAEWAKEYKMPFSQGKSEAMWFSMNNMETGQGIQLRLGDDWLQVKEQVRLLGVILDKRLAFGPHIKQLLADCNRRFKQMVSIAGTDWGSSAVDLRALYIAYIRSKVLYCSPVFSSFLSTALQERLDVLERKALRVITGCARSTPIPALQLEAALPPLRDRFKEVVAIVEEKLRRFPAGDVLHNLALTYVPSGVRFAGHLAVTWQMASDEVLRKAGITPARLTKVGNVRQQHRAIARERLLLYPRCPPWSTQGTQYIHLLPNLSGVYDASSDRQVKLDQTKRTLEELKAVWNNNNPFALETWTDGAAVPDGPQHGIGAASLRTVAEDGTEFVHEVQLEAAAAGERCSPFRAECTGLVTGLRILHRWCLDAAAGGLVVRERKHPTTSFNGEVILICTASREIITALQKGALAQTSPLLAEIWWQLLVIVRLAHPKAVLVQWVPRQVGLPRHDQANKYARAMLTGGGESPAIRAKARTLLDQQAAVPVPLECVKAAVRRSIRGAWRTQHHTIAREDLAGPEPTPVRVGVGLTRADETLLAQLRTGFCRRIGPLRYHLQLTQSRVCRWCPGGEESETVHHLLFQCQNRQVQLLRERLKLPRRTPPLANVGLKRMQEIVDFFKELLAMVE